MMKRIFNLILFFTGISLVSCNSPFTAKPTGYFKIDFPKRNYQTFDQPGYPYSFQYPTYAQVIKDTSYFWADDPYGVNVYFPSFNGKIYLSYKTVGGESVYKIKRDGKYIDSIGINDFNRLVKDAYNLSYRNDVKAYSIDDSLMKTPNGISGIYFTLTGNVATANQFFLSDSTKHFLRGALYFNTTPNEDSLALVNNFLEVDLKHLINTVRWK